MTATDVQHNANAMWAPTSCTRPRRPPLCRTSLIRGGGSRRSRGSSHRTAGKPIGSAAAGPCALCQISGLSDENVATLTAGDLNVADGVATIHTPRAERQPSGTSPTILLCGPCTLARWVRRPPITGIAAAGKTTSHRRSPRARTRQGWWQRTVQSRRHWSIQPAPHGADSRTGTRTLERAGEPEKFS